ncbi:hypothetical protein [Haloechinothrix sp. LS1_15]|uniref:hypothetical protein n=1 Tax=Haloechinothrix sp. LS1_15 TaxID=2652248 RepID=UPI0029488630|nr:hypothetical protein [Haloechinothrix sp. LS1_15]MDV6013710.1 hypothetical protein [Haloechinothrix sp. LS1_15]
MPAPDTWRITCRDLAGRRRAVTVSAIGDTIVLTAPPGESAVLSRLDVGRLRAALRDAVLSTDPTSEPPEPPAID